MAKRLYQREVIVAPLKFTALDCANCGVPFGITEEYEERRREDGHNFYCPNGHANAWNSQRQRELDEAKKAAARLQERLDAERGWSAQLESDLHTERKSHATTKGQLTRAKKRASAGVCLHCNRHFENVERHMKSKHTEEPTEG